MNINENAIYSSFINNISYTDKSSNERTEINSKGINSVVDYSQFKHNIIISPKVLEKMGKDPKYALEFQ
ncbi:hypothetical protein JCM14036_17040 [Desulfotomaculum defluvii]